MFDTIIVSTKNIMPPKLKFAEGNTMSTYEVNNYNLNFSGEKVLCFHGPLIYEAKCLKSTITKEKQVKYFIHYAGWNKK